MSTEPWPNRPRRCSPVYSTRPELRSRDARYAVVTGQPFVHEGVVGGEQVEEAPVLPNEAVEQQLGLAAHRIGELPVEVREPECVRLHLVHVLEPQPQRREPGGQRLRPRVGQHAPRLGLEHLRLRQRPRRGPRHQDLIGRGAPQEEGQPRGQGHVRNAVVPPRLDGAGRPLQPEEEVGAGQGRLKRGADAGLPVAVREARVVERHEIRQIGFGQRPAVRPGGQTRDDFLGAGALGVGRGRTATEDLPAAGGFRYAGNVVGTVDDEVPHVRQGGDAVPEVADLGVDDRPLMRRQDVFDRPLELPDEHRRDALGARPHDDRRFDFQIYAVGIGGPQPLVHRQQGHRLAVDRDLDLLVPDGRSGQAAGRRVLERHPEDVLPVGREVVHHREPAAAAVRGSLHLLPLGSRARDLA